MPLFNPSITPAELAALQQINSSQETAIASLQQTIAAQAALNLDQAGAIATLQQQVAALAADPTWIPLTFVGGWRDYSSAFFPAAYCKVQGWVHLRGLVAAGIAGSTIATLPTGFRPSHRAFCVANSRGGSGDALGRIDIFATGEITHVAGGTSWIGLDGISFWVG
jgi:hypothetical protein